MSELRHGKSTEARPPKAAPAGWSGDSRPEKPEGRTAGTVGLQQRQAFADRDQPSHRGDDERDADRGRAHVLDAADPRVERGGDVIRELLDGGVEQLDDDEKQDGGNQRETLPGVGRDQKGQRYG